MLHQGSGNDQLQRQLDDLQRESLQRRINEEQAALAGQPSAAAASSAAGGVHPDRKPQVKFSANVLIGHFPSAAERAAYVNSFQAATLHEMVDRHC